MRVHPKEWHGNIWQNITSRIYLASLYLYPKGFRYQFGSEMVSVFEEARDEHAHNGPSSLFIFLGRELTEAPGSILNQHLATKSFWVQPYPINVMAFTLGFTLLGMIDGLNYLQVLNGIQSSLLNLFSYLFVGGISGLAIGCILNPDKKKRFAFSGAIGFLLANTLVAQIYFGIFPDAFRTPQGGISFFIPFLYPILTGSVFGLFIGIANRIWHDLFRYSGMGSLALFTGFFVNRLSAALMQSFLFPGSSQNIAQTGNRSLFVCVIPFLLEGMLLGILFGRMTSKNISVSA